MPCGGRYFANGSKRQVGFTQAQKMKWLYPMSKDYYIKKAWELVYYEEYEAL
jgi:hypothetical protein